MLDCHLHSFFSGDSKMDAEEACKKAINMDLSGIAFTDHLDFDFPEFEEEYMIDFCRYNEFMDNLKLKYKSKLKVIKGIEVGIQPHTIIKSDRVVSSYNFDYVLASVHVIDGMDPYNKGFFDNKTKHQSFSRYLELILHMISSWDNFDMVGHFDYITRKCCYDDNTLRYHDLSDLFDLIFKKLIDKGKGFEINTACYRNKPILPGKNFDIDFLKRYKELGGELICVGSDAHKSEHVGFKVNEVIKILKTLGFEYTTYYINRKPMHMKIK